MALFRRFEILPLGTYGVRRQDFAVLVEKAAKASMKANPIMLTAEELTEIITRAA